MVETVAGLPTHILVIHAVVAFVPLVALAVLVMVLSVTWLERLRWPVVLLATVTAAATFLAKSTGETFLATRPTVSQQLRHHADLGAVTPYVVFGAWFLLVVWVAYAARAGLLRSGGQPTGVRVVGVIVVAAWAAATADVLVAGHSGALAVWG